MRGQVASGATNFPSLAASGMARTRGSGVTSVEAMLWLLADAGGQPVLLRPDSTHVWDLVTGVAHASCNQALGASRARAVRVPPGAAGGQGGVGEGGGARGWGVPMERARGHAGRLRGTQCEAEAAGGLGEDWAAVRLDGPLHPLRAMRARWAAVCVVVTHARGLLTVAETVTWAGAEEWHVAPGASPAEGEPAGEGDVPEVLRIERALHEFGVLNLYPRVMRDEEVEAARVDVERALGAERASACPAR